MSQIGSTLEFSTTSDRWKTLQRAWQLFARTFNGEVGFGDGTKRDNIDGNWVSVVTPVAVNTDFTINHTLNRVPVGYLTMQKSAACDVYTGSVAATKTQLTLRASVGAVALKLFILSLALALLTAFNAPRSEAQSVAFHDTATFNSNGTVKVIPSAVITVCPFTGPTSIVAPCTPSSVALFKDSALTQAITNPFNADVNGNFFFWVLTGNYVVSITGAGVNGLAYPITPGGGVGALPGNLFRIQPILGSPLLLADFTNPSTTGWGTGATISNITGSDTAFSFTVTAGTFPSIDPQVKLTFHDGPWLSILTVTPDWVGGTGSASDFSYTTDLASLTLTFLALPTATKSYNINVVVTGNSNVITPPSPPINPVLLNPSAPQNIMNFPLGAPQFDVYDNNTPGNPTANRLRVYSKTDDKLYYRNSAGLESLITTGMSTGGTVTSVALTVPGDLFNLSGSPVTTAGTFALTKALVSAKSVYSGPPSGGSAQPSFNLLTTAYLPFTYTGNTTLLLTCASAITPTHSITVDVNGNCIDSGAITPLVQHARVSGGSICTTGTSSFNTCPVTISWPQLFTSGTSYDGGCWGVGPVDAANTDKGRVNLQVVSKSASGITVNVVGLGSSAVTWNEIDCIGAQ